MSTSRTVNPFGWHVLAQTPDGWTPIYFFGRVAGRPAAERAAAQWFQPTALVFARSLDIQAGHAYATIPRDAFGEQLSTCTSRHVCQQGGGVA